MAVLNEFQAIVGTDHAREGEASDSIDGVQPRFVAAPATIEETAAVLAHADGAGLRVTPRGAGTLLGLGNPPSGIDVVLDMRRLDQILEHATGDLVVSVETGVTAGRLEEVLGSAGQMFALDVPDERATVGGMIAANVSGPRRYRYGTIRDLLIGVTIVLADGTVAKAGGKVVKNVAGYDLSKLMTGSLGTLGVIVRANLRLHPRAEGMRIVEVELPGPEAIAPAVQRLLHSPVVPSAIQLRWPREEAPRMAILFEGPGPSTAAQAATAIGLLRDDVTDASERERGAAKFWAGFNGPPAADGDISIRVTSLPARLSETAALVHRATRRLPGGAHLSGPVGSGILNVHLGATDPKTIAEVLGEIRAGLKAGHAVVTAAPLDIKRMVDVWGPVGGSLELMRRVKARFDPNATLNPGRFVGGI